MLKYPKMIIFDYGHTLLYEPGYNTLNGELALFQYIKHNPNIITPEQANDFVKEICREFEPARKLGYEIHEHTILRYKCERLGLRYTVPFDEAERILWNNISPGAVMPGAEEMLDFLAAKQIRTAVISNIMFSERALADRINRLLPRNQFEFIVTSSEYAIRKPNPRLFKLALHKAGLDAKDVWYCGDDPQKDVDGASQAGIFPVWYDNDTDQAHSGHANNISPKSDHLHIHEWSEMTVLLDQLENAN